jgi:hypothetical protein
VALPLCQGRHGPLLWAPSLGPAFQGSFPLSVGAGTSQDPQGPSWSTPHPTPSSLGSALVTTLALAELCQGPASWGLTLTLPPQASPNTPDCTVPPFILPTQQPPNILVPHHHPFFLGLGSHPGLADQVLSPHSWRRSSRLSRRS